MSIEALVSLGSVMSMRSFEYVKSFVSIEAFVSVGSFVSIEAFVSFGSFCVSKPFHYCDKDGIRIIKITCLMFYGSPSKY